MLQAGKLLLCCWCSVDCELAAAEMHVFNSIILSPRRLVQLREELRQLRNRRARAGDRDALRPSPDVNEIMRRREAVRFHTQGYLRFGSIE